MKLLSTQNFKTVKGEKFGILTGILYLAPAKLSGFEVCPKRSEGCTASCLYSAGMGAFSNVQKARIQKTLFYFGDRPKFLELIKEDIKKLQKQAKKDGQKLAIRLNGTSDLNWMQHDVFSSFPDVQFYDYTKVFNRLTKEIPSNYHLTFSKSENNDSECIQALKLGFNVAVVFDTKKGDALPASWNGFPVYDGDDTDTRFLDPKGGYVIGLRAKGQAKKDISGFVVTLNNAA
jgi:hypothetical protein